MQTGSASAFPPRAVLSLLMILGHFPELKLDSPEQVIYFQYQERQSGWFSSL
jgi:hypothetical protein